MCWLIPFLVLKTKLNSFHLLKTKKCFLVSFVKKKFNIFFWLKSVGLSPFWLKKRLNTFLLVENCLVYVLVGWNWTYRACWGNGWNLICFQHHWLLWQFHVLSKWFCNLGFYLLVYIFFSKKRYIVKSPNLNILFTKYLQPNFKFTPFSYEKYYLNY